MVKLLLVSLLFASNSLYAQTASNVNSLAYTDPLAFTQQNIQNYFPDQESEQQAIFLINRLGK